MSKERKILPQDVGRRLLLTNEQFKTDLVELKLLEISPSGKRVKFENCVRTTFWEELGERLVVEVLP